MKHIFVLFLLQLTLKWKQCFLMNDCWDSKLEKTDFSFEFFSLIFANTHCDAVSLQVEWEKKDLNRNKTDGLSNSLIFNWIMSNLVQVDCMIYHYAECIQGQYG